MYSGLRRIIILLAVALAGSACATSEQWAEWRQHPTHFASGEHAGFSLRHRGANPAPRVSQRDVDTAKAESWWGEPIVVRPEQIFTN
jgi:hypothetical protein